MTSDKRNSSKISLIFSKFSLKIKRQKFNRCPSESKVRKFLHKTNFFEWEFSFSCLFSSRWLNENFAKESERIFGNPTLNRKKLKIKFNFRYLDIFFHVLPELYFWEQQSSFTVGTFSNRNTDSTRTTGRTRKLWKKKTTHKLKLWQCNFAIVGCKHSLNKVSDLIRV